MTRQAIECAQLGYVAAAKIVELVKAGLSDPDELYSAALNDFKKR